MPLPYAKFPVIAGFGFVLLSAQPQNVQQQERYQVFRAQAQQAYHAEMAREKAGDCPNAISTREQEECLDSESGKTEANYKSFTSAIRALLETLGAEDVAEFDHLEAESITYRKVAAQAAFHRYKGGSLAPVFQAEASQEVLRLHMRELAFIYEIALSNR